MKTPPHGFATPPTQEFMGGINFDYETPEAEDRQELTYSASFEFEGLRVRLTAYAPVNTAEIDTTVSDQTQTQPVEIVLFTITNNADDLVSAITITPDLFVEETKGMAKDISGAIGASRALGDRCRELAAHLFKTGLTYTLFKTEPEVLRMEEWRIADHEPSKLPGARWVDIYMDIRCNTTGEVRRINDICLLQEEDQHPSTSMWEEGNYSCDCNRHSFFHDSGYDEGYHCSMGLFSVRASNALTGKVFYSEFDL